MKSLFFRIITGIFCTVVITISSFFIFNYLSNIKKPHLAIGPQKQYKIHNTLPIIEKPVEIDGQIKSDTYLLGETGMEMLINKIEKRTGFGPEFFALNQVIITNQEKWIEKNFEGLYLMQFQQIILNTNTVFQEYKAEWRSQDTEFLDAITEIIYQTFYHEYLHHVANIYLVGIGHKNELNDYSMYINNYVSNANPRYPQPWNKKFLQKFKKYLSYDQSNSPSPYEPDHYIQEARSKRPAMTNNKYVKSIASIYKAKELFDIANGPQIPHYSKMITNDEQLYVWAPIKSDITIPIKPQNVGYYYSLDELFARKYMQLTFPWHNVNSWYINNNGFWGKNKNRLMTYSLDTAMYQSLDTNILYLEDAPFKTPEVADGLIDLYQSFIGQKDGSHISVIWNQNTGGKIVNENNEDFFLVPQINSNIKFGGFIDNNANNFKYIGYWDKNQFKSSEITVFDYQFNRLTHLKSSNRIPVNKNQKFYVVNEWLNKNAWINRELYFATSSAGANAQPLTLLKDEKYGLVSTQRFHNHQNNNVHKLYIQRNSNQKIIISDV